MAKGKQPDEEQPDAGSVGIQQRLEAKLEQVLSELKDARVEIRELRDWSKRMARKAGVTQA